MKQFEKGENFLNFVFRLFQSAERHIIKKIDYD